MTILHDFGNGPITTKQLLEFWVVYIEEIKRIRQKYNHLLHCSDNNRYVKIKWIPTSYIVPYSKFFLKSFSLMLSELEECKIIHSGIKHDEANLPVIIDSDKITASYLFKNSLTPELGFKPYFFEFLGDLNRDGVKGISLVRILEEPRFIRYSAYKPDPENWDGILDPFDFTDNIEFNRKFCRENGYRIFKEVSYENSHVLWEPVAISYFKNLSHNNIMLFWESFGYSTLKIKRSIHVKDMEGRILAVYGRNRILVDREKLDDFISKI